MILISGSKISKICPKISHFTQISHFAKISHFTPEITLITAYQSDRLNAVKNVKKGSDIRHIHIPSHFPCASPEIVNTDTLLKSLVWLESTWLKTSHVWLQSRRSYRPKKHTANPQTNVRNKGDIRIKNNLRA